MDDKPHGADAWFRSDSEFPRNKEDRLTPNSFGDLPAPKLNYPLPADPHDKDHGQRDSAQVSDQGLNESVEVGYDGSIAGYGFHEATSGNKIKGEG